MPEISNTGFLIKRTHFSTGHAMIGSFIPVAFTDTDLLSQEAFIRGKEEGRKDLEMELLKMQKALTRLAFEKASEIAQKIIDVGTKSNIRFFNIYLKVKDWDNINILFVVDVDDFVDDKIESLYTVANEMSEEYNTDEFHFDYSITYSSDSLNKDRILTDGFTFNYAEPSESRKA